MFDPVSLIVEYCRNGDQQAFNRFYRQQANKLWGFLCARGAQPDFAYDLLSESFIKFSQVICQDPRSPVAFLYRIAINLHIDSHRRTAARPETVDTLVTEQAIDESQPLDEKEWLRRLLKTLPTDEQNLLLLRYWIGLSHREIATILQRPEGTVRRQAATALKTLRQRWQEG